jgi:signal-transduction protein with cAMP-binding, CBS, and nucleotidyltransferase domain
VTGFFLPCKKNVHRAAHRAVLVLGGKMFGHIGEIIGKKHGRIWSIHPDDSVFHALEILAERDIGFLLVMEGGNLIGVLSERDYARKVVLRGKASKTTTVREIMIPEVITITPGHTFEEAMRIMSIHHIRHLPVMVGRRVMGVISMADVVQACLDNQMETIHFLEDVALDR